MESQGMNHKCSCCTELEVMPKEVEMQCANGKRKTFYYNDVVKCGCSVATCEPVGSDEQQQEQQDEQQWSQSTFRGRSRRR